MRITENGNLKSLVNDIDTIGKFNELQFLHDDILNKLYGVGESNLKFGKMFFYGECTMMSGSKQVRCRKRIEIEFLTERHHLYVMHLMDELLTWYNCCKGPRTSETFGKVLYCATRYYRLWLEGTQQLKNIDWFHIYDVKIQEDELCG